MRIGTSAMIGLLAMAAWPATAQTVPAPLPALPPPARSVLGRPAHHPAHKLPAHIPPAHKPPAHKPPAHKPPVLSPPHGARPVKTAIKPAPAVPPPAPPRILPPPTSLPPTASPPADKGSVTGLPMPRFVSLRTNDVNMRSGPGLRYPVEWQYHRRGLPIEIKREFDVWRLVVDQDGVEGWVHQATIVSGRSFVVTGAERTLRAAASETAAPVARLMPGVVGRIRHCRLGQDWCELQLGAYRGWMKRADFWGTFPGEAVN